MTRFLLDTHIFVWTKTAERPVRPHILSQMADPSNEVMVSLASAWELCIKAAVGKLTGDASLLVGEEASFELALETSGLQMLPILPLHIFAVRNLPLHHRDPFDRLIVAQAIAERMTLITVDRRLEAYAGLNMILGA
jgi:PIN domain nuclease of toxin-antitoxin system